MIKVVITLLFLSFCLVEGCDEYSWEQVNLQFDRCVNRSLVELEKFTTELEHCQAYEDVLLCSEILTLCTESHFTEVEQRLVDVYPDEEDMILTIKACNSLKSSLRVKRSPKKRGGSSSTRSRVSAVANRGKQAISGILGRRGSSGSSRSGLSRGAGLGGVAAATQGVKKKKSFVRKYGKYAVAGLAAYGTYKLAKTMSKGLRGSYDDDDCWEYSIFQNQYQCVCPGQCNVYVGSATSMGVFSGLIASCLTIVYLQTRNNFLLL